MKAWWIVMSFPGAEIEEQRRLRVGVRALSRWSFSHSPSTNVIVDSSFTQPTIGKEQTRPHFEDFFCEFNRQSCSDSEVLGLPLLLGNKAINLNWNENNG
jgi:hypothetical protein